MENKLYYQILIDNKSAVRFKRKTLGRFFTRKRTISIDKLTEIFPKINKKYTSEDGKKFILRLLDMNDKWRYYSNPGYNYYLLFNHSSDNRIKINKIRDYILINENDENNG